MNDVVMNRNDIKSDQTADEVLDSLITMIGHTLLPYFVVFSIEV